MSGSGGSNKEAMALQRESLEEQRRANATQLDFLAQQTKALAKTKLPAYVPGSPPPTPGTSGQAAAGTAERLAAARRFGLKDSIRGGLKGGLGNY